MIPLVEPSQSELVTQLESKGKRENRFFRMMAHKPEVLKNFVPLYAAIVGPGAADRRTKELVYLAASLANEAQSAKNPTDSKRLHALVAILEHPAA